MTAAVDEYDLRREVERALAKHQPRYGERGPGRTCSCNTIIGGGLINDAVADHQAKEVVCHLRRRGLIE